MSALMPRFTPCWIAVVIAGTCFGLVGEVTGQTQDEVAARIVRARGAIFRDDEGNVVTVTINFATDEFVESVNFSAFGKLSSVTIRSYGLTDKSLIHLRKTIQGLLMHLHIHGGKISGQELGLLLKKHRSLISLTLSGEPATDSVLSEIGSLKDLTCLWLWRTKITDEGLRSLTGLTNLKILDLESTSVTDSGLAQIAKLSSLRALRLHETKITDDGIIMLSDLTELRSLYLSRTHVTEKGKSALMKWLPDLAFK